MSLSGTSPTSRRIRRFTHRNIVTPERAGIYSPRDRSTSISGERTQPARKLIISDGDNRQLVIYWFSMRGMTIPNEFALKWHQMTSALLARSQAASFIRFSTLIPAGGDEAVRAGLVGFIEDISPHVHRGAYSHGKTTTGADTGMSKVIIKGSADAAERRSLARSISSAFQAFHASLTLLIDRRGSPLPTWSTSFCRCSC